jgi:hypothetical protein
MVSRKLCVAALLPALLGGCTEDPKGQLVIAVQTDVHLPKDIDTIRIEVFNEGEPKFKNDYERLGTEEAPFLLPGTLTAVASEDPTDVVRMIVSGRSGGSNGKLRMVREVVTTVPEARTATLQLPLQYLCDGQALVVDGEAQSDCPEGQTCLAGTCADDGIDSAGLPDYDPDEIFVEGICLDVAVCFNQGEVAPVDAEDCTIDAPAAETNIALQTEGDGICGALGCFVALDAESALGWQTRDDGRIQLPPAVCSQIDAGKIVNVVAAPTNGPCPLKQVSVPTCGPWSAAGLGAPNTGAVALAGGQSQPVSVRIGQGAIFWASAGTFSGEGTIKSVGAIGGTPVLEATGTLPPRDLAVGPNNTLYWTRSDETMPLSGAIVVKDSAGEMDLFANQPLPEGIALFGSKLYWTEFSPTGGIFSANTTDMDGEDVQVGVGNYPVRIVADDEHVYWTNEGSAGQADGSVVRYALSTAVTETIAANVDTPRGLTLDRTDEQTTALYWTVFQEGGSVMRVSVDNGVLGEVTEVASGLSFPNGITVHTDGFVYWCNRGDGSVMRVSNSGSGSPETIASGQRSPGALVVDDTSIYWLNEGSAGQENGALMRIAKPF